jgi:hypothetical protein
MSIESQIYDGLNNLRPRCAVSNFALIAGVCSPARVNTALNGQRPFDSADGLAHHNIFKRMQELAELIAPVPIDWSETATIKGLLAGLGDKTLHISVSQEQPIVAEPQFMIFLTNMYFVRRAKNELGKMEISGSYQTSGAVRVSKNCADKLIAALVTVGYRAQLVPSPYRNEDGGCDDFAMLWGEPEPVPEPVLAEETHGDSI